MERERIEAPSFAPPPTINRGGRRAASRRLASTVFGFCAAHDKPEPAREDASPPTAVQRHTRILWRHRIPVPRPNAERRSLARVPEPTPQGRLRPITPRFAKNASLEASLQKNRHNNFITPR